MLQNNHFSEGPRQAYRLCFCSFQFTTQKVSKTQGICSPGRSERYPPGGYVGATIIHQEGYASREGGGSAIGWMPALFLCPKCGSQSIGLVPKRTIPLGGMVALGRFPQEEWFPPPLIWHRKGRQRGEHRRRKTKNRTSFEFENMKSMSLETRFQLQACLLVYKDLPQGCFPV